MKLPPSNPLDFLRPARIRPIAPLISQTPSPFTFLSPRPRTKPLTRGRARRYEARLHGQLTRDLTLFAALRAARHAEEAVELELRRKRLCLARIDKDGHFVDRRSTDPRHKQFLDLERELGIHYGGYRP